MKHETQKDEILTRYLLCDLPDEERLRVEERFFQDDSYFEELLSLEDELIYEYRQGNLNARERLLFEKHLLTSSQDKRKAKFADVFLKTIDDFASQKEKTEEKAFVSIPFWKSFSSFFNFQNHALRFATAALLLLFLIGGIWLFVKNNQLKTEVANLQRQQDEQQKLKREFEEKQKEKERLETELARETQEREKSQDQIKKLEEERAELEKEIEAARNGQTSQNRSSIFAVLLPGLSRSSGQQAKTITITKDTNIIRLQLQLKRAGVYKNYKIALSNVDDGNAVFNRSNLKAARVSVTVQIPVTNLKNGDYEIILQGITANGDAEEIDDYYFRVVKRL